MWQKSCSFKKKHETKSISACAGSKTASWGLDVDKNADQRIESGQRFVTDIELVVLAKVLNVSIETLLAND